MINLSSALTLLLLTPVSASSTGNGRQAKPGSGALDADGGVGGHTKNMEARIIGGTVAPLDAYEFFVKWDGCGASLIYEDIVLSAAHCVDIFSNEVSVGAHFDSAPDPGAEARTIVSRRIHPQFDGSTLDHDFLLLKLSEPSTKTPVPINLDFQNPSPGDVLTVMGFGDTIPGANSGSENLLEVDVNAVSHEQCYNQYDAIGSTIEEDVMFCAGVDGGGKDSCQGDSGGPIIDSNGSQVGVVSWGEGCALAGFAGVYARVSGVDEWIMEKICELSANPPQEGCPEPASCDNPHYGSGSVCVNFSFFLDEYPEETTAELVSLETGEIIHMDGFDAPLDQLDRIVRLDPGEYLFTIFDSYGDGMCCDYGEGYFEAHAVFPDEDVLLARIDGLFESSVQIDLSVPMSPTSTPPPSSPGTSTPSPTPTGTYSPSPTPTGTYTFSPTPTGTFTFSPTPTGTYTFSPTPTGTYTFSPTSADTSTISPGDCYDQSGTFHGDSVVGEVDCTWLSNNMVRYNYLCQFLDVAAVCHYTCDACEYFAD